MNQRCHISYYKRNGQIAAAGQMGYGVLITALA